MLEQEFEIIIARRLDTTPDVVRRDGMIKNLFQYVDPRLAQVILLDIFQYSIVVSKPLCESEKETVRQIKSWPNKSTNLEHVCRCFLERDFT